MLDAPVSVTDAPGAIALPPVRGEIVFDDVSFRYRPDTGPILDDLSLRIEPGQTAALVGDSGAGKSTVFALVSRFWDPDAGRVLVDGHDLRDVTQDSLRRQIASVQQETFLFGASVAENIRYARPNASDDEVEEAARAANAHGFIAALPDGYETLVGERGVKLSGGQRQRLSVARAFLADPRILLLDEATSAVEPDSERVIQDALARLMRGPDHDPRRPPPVHGPKRRRHLRPGWRTPGRAGHARRADAPGRPLRPPGAPAARRAGDGFLAPNNRGTGEE